MLQNQIVHTPKRRKRNADKLSEYGDEVLDTKEHQKSTVLLSETLVSEMKNDGSQQGSVSSQTKEKEQDVDYD